MVDKQVYEINKICFWIKNILEEPVVVNIQYRTSSNQTLQISLIWLLFDAFRSLIKCSWKKHFFFSQLVTVLEKKVLKQIKNVFPNYYFQIEEHKVELFSVISNSYLIKKINCNLLSPLNFWNCKICHKLISFIKYNKQW